MLSCGETNTPNLYSHAVRDPNFHADIARCHHTNARLKFVLVLQINNTQLPGCRKTNEHALHVYAKMACFGWAQRLLLAVLQILDMTQIKFPKRYKLQR